MQEVSADKAYLSADNLQTVIDHAAMPYIPFKSNSAGTRSKNTLWRRMYHYFSYNQSWFLQQYHKRSNVESTFSMIKAKFGDSLRSKTKTAQEEAMKKNLKSSRPDVPTVYTTRSGSRYVRAIDVIRSAAGRKELSLQLKNQPKSSLKNSRQIKTKS